MSILTFTCKSDSWLTHTIFLYHTKHLERRNLVNLYGSCGFILNFKKHRSYFCIHIHSLAHTLSRIPRFYVRNISTDMPINKVHPNRDAKEHDASLATSSERFINVCRCTEVIF